MLLFKRYKSNNHGPRADGVQPSMLVLHYTGMRTAKEALRRLCDPASEVSAHYVIEESGKRHQLVADDRRAWHAGKSCWQGIEDINSVSLGVEIVNPGHEFGYREFPEKQIVSVIKLCRQMVEKYQISASRVLAHSDVAPGRKTDPGEFFPWQRLADEGVGLWPRPQEMDYQAAEDLIVNHDALHELLLGYGYDAREDFPVLLEAFHRHFYPERILSGHGREPDIMTGARLLALIRARHDNET